MKSIRPFILVSAIIISAVWAVGQSPLSSWPFFVEVTSNGAAGIYHFTVPLQIMGAARDDLGDLRLLDSQNREVPYAIRIRKNLSEQREFGVTVFNQVTTGSATEATIDLGENPGEHNEVQIQTEGSNFRRRVTVEGSDSRNDWRTLKTDAAIFAFRSDGKMAESNNVAYPTSRYRYLRVRVSRDEISDDSPPHINTLRVLLTVQEKGELTTWNVFVPPYQLSRNQGAHASSWTIDFGSPVPCDRLSIAISDPSFYRAFEVDAFDDPQNPKLVANGYLSRRVGDDKKPEVIQFDQEQHVRKLRLQITDYSNPTLSIESIQASAPARELIFELRQPERLPLRLFYGNPKIPEPHYDFEKELTDKLKKPAAETSLGQVTNNPAYTPEPLPFTERLPWLIYLVLAVSSLALGWILLSLARTALRSNSVDQSEAQP